MVLSQIKFSRVIIPRQFLAGGNVFQSDELHFFKMYIAIRVAGVIKKIINTSGRGQKSVLIHLQAVFSAVESRMAPEDQNFFAFSDSFGSEHPFTADCILNAELFEGLHERVVKEGFKYFSMEKYAKNDNLKYFLR